MESGNQKSFLTISLKSILISLLLIIIILLFAFKNIFFQSTFLIKNLGDQSVDPQLAFKNNKPTFLEFYAEWCEVCKEMAPKISALKDEYEKEVNFVFLNVDNPKWDYYIKKFNVNGIPQINLFDSQTNLQDTFMGRHEINILKDSLDHLNDPNLITKEVFNSEYSPIKENKNYITSARSHG